MYDLIIRNATVFAGDECLPLHADLAVADDIITAMDKGLTGSSKREIDAAGMFLTPGFIDIHGHSDLDIFLNPTTSYKIKQGITSETTGNCGFSLFPVIEKYIDEAFEFLLLLFDGLEKKFLFSSAEAFFEMTKYHAVNIVPLVGHNTARIAVGGSQRKLDREKRRQMLELLEKQFRMGVSGISTGLLYPPACFADTEELSAIGNIVKKYNGLFSWHIRDEGDALEASLEELVQVAKSTKARTQISHLKAAGKNNWGKINKAFDIINSAHNDGCKIGFDCYPYTFGCSAIRTLLPESLLPAGPDVLAQKLKNRNFRAELENNTLLKSSLFQSTGPENIIIAGGKAEHSGKSLAQIAKECRQSTFDTLCDILVEERGMTSIFLRQMNCADVEAAIARPEGMISTDGIPRLSGLQHPRLTNSFTHFLLPVIKSTSMSQLSTALKKTAPLPAKQLGLAKRGTIKIGNYADLCIINPYSSAEGFPESEEKKIIEYVIVNGRITVEKGSFDPAIKAGKILTMEKI